MVPLSLQEDIDKGYVRSNATLDGWSPSPGTMKFSTEDAEAVMVPRQMNISVEKNLLSISESEGLDSTNIDPGDSAIFEVTIMNTGNTVLKSVELTDSVVGAEAIDCDQDFTDTYSRFLPDSHPSGASLVCHVTVLLTASYVDDGGFNSTSKVGPQEQTYAGGYDAASEEAPTEYFEVLVPLPLARYVDASAILQPEALFRRGSTKTTEITYHHFHAMIRGVTHVP